MALDPVIVFVARANVRDAPDVNDANKWLRESLNPVVRRYEMAYGLGSRAPRFYTFVHDCQRALIQSGPHFRYFTGLVDECHQEGSDLILVLRDWVAITAYDISFLRLFDRCSTLPLDVSIRVFDSDPRLDHPFFEVNVAQVCSVMNGEIELEDEAVENNTVFFMVKILDAAKAEVFRGMDPTEVQVSLWLL